MTDHANNGDRKCLEGKECIHYDGYWIRYYPVPEDTLSNRKKLILGMTRRAFHHTESGINTPGGKLETAREAYRNETNPDRKRVNAAMLAGALFNRATDIFTSIVDLEAKGVHIANDNELMVECGVCFAEALELGRQVKHNSGQEGIDEVWGEPFKAFAQPLSKVFESRYQKIAQTLRDLDLIIDAMIDCLQDDLRFGDMVPLVEVFAIHAKEQIETAKNDDAFFSIWPAFVASRERLMNAIPTDPPIDSIENLRHFEQGVKLITSGTALITYLSEARVPMPKSTQEFLRQCELYIADEFNDKELSVVLTPAKG